MERPLDGLRVLDFSRQFPGPYCTYLLQELGARVVKVEDTETGDPARQYAPRIDGAGAAFVVFHRGKESVSLNLKLREGQTVARQIAERSDVVVEGFRPGVARRLGIDFEALSAGNRRLVYCAISGYGQEGEQRDLPGHDLAYAAASGLLDALSPGRPIVPGIQLVDAASALVAVIRILAVLPLRDAGPHYLDVPMLAGAEALMPTAFSGVGQGGPTSLEDAPMPVQAGISRPTGPGQSDGEDQGTRPIAEILRGSERYNLFRCVDDRWIAITPLEDRFWHNFREMLIGEGLISGEERITPDILRRILGGRGSAEWLALLNAADVPANLVRSVEEVARDGPRFPVIPRDAGDARPIPRLGEHTARWLRSLGYSDRDIRRLEREGVIRTAEAAERP